MNKWISSLNMRTLAGSAFFGAAALLTACPTLLLVTILALSFAVAVGCLLGLLESLYEAQP